MKVVFRVDSSLMIGSGHVMRCLVLAEQLKRKGYEVIFACTPLVGDMHSFIEQRGFSVSVLPEPKQVITPKHDADYAAWLQKSVVQDAQDFIANVMSADLVITDHYAIGAHWQSLVKQAFGCWVLAIDDLARSHQADLVLDQTLGRHKSEYPISGAIILTGSEYAILSPSFSSKREKALSRKLPLDGLRVLVSMGGVDAPNATLKVLNALIKNIGVEFTVLLSPRAPHYEEVAKWCSDYANVLHLDFVSDMASLLLEHDIAIGAPGTTSWERACLGLPSLIVPLADNQKMISEQLVKAQAAIKVEIEDIPQQLPEAYSNLVKKWSDIKQANLILCDGLGVRRVLCAIEQLFETDSAPFSLELASQDDIETIYQWQCHPQTRKYALNPRQPSWKEHQTWMSKKLCSASDYFYIVTNHHTNRKLGVVRLDWIESGHYLVSIFIEPRSYGQGVASRALALLDAVHPDVTLHATVLKANIASHRLFRKARYQQIDDESFIRQPID